MRQTENFTVCMFCNYRALDSEWTQEPTGKRCPCGKHYAHYRTSWHGSASSEEIRREEKREQDQRER
jgi:hypothetical protein